MQRKKHSLLLRTIQPVLCVVLKVYPLANILGGNLKVRKLAGGHWVGFWDDNTHTSRWIHSQSYYPQNKLPISARSIYREMYPTL